MKLRDWVPPPHGSEQSPQSSIAPTQSTGHEIAVLHGCVSALPAATVHSAPSKAAGVVMVKVREATPSGPQGSEHALSAPYSPTQLTGGGGQS